MSEQRCVQLNPELKTWILEYACRHRLLDIVKVCCEGITEDHSVDSPLSLRIVAAGLWSVMKNRAVAHYDRIVDFLDVIHKQIPNLVEFRHYIKICVGLKAKIILDMFSSNQPLLSIMKKLNVFFPANGFENCTSTRRDRQKLRRCCHQFRRLVLRMIRDDSYRKTYVEEELEDEYGELFTAALEKLLWEYLERLESGLPKTTIEQLLAFKGDTQCLTEGENLLAELLARESHSVPTVLQSLLQCAAMQSSPQEPESLPLSPSRTCPPNTKSLSSAAYTSCLDRYAENHSADENQREHCNSKEIDFSFGPQVSSGDSPGPLVKLKRTDPEETGSVDRNQTLKQCTCDNFNLQPCREPSETGDRTMIEAGTLSERIQTTRQGATETSEQVGHELDEQEEGAWEIEETPETPQEGVGSCSSRQVNAAQHKDESMAATKDKSNSGEDLICLGDADIILLSNTNHERDQESSRVENRNTGAITNPSVNEVGPVFSILKMDYSFENSEEAQSPPDPFQSQKLSQMNKASEYNLPRAGVGGEGAITNVTWWQESQTVGYSETDQNWAVSLKEMQQKECGRHPRLVTNVVKQSAAKETTPSIILIGNPDSWLRQSTAKGQSFAVQQKCEPYARQHSQNPDVITAVTPSLKSIGVPGGNQYDPCSRNSLVFNGVKVSVERQISLLQPPRLQPVVRLNKLTSDISGSSFTGQYLDQSSLETEEEESHSFGVLQPSWSLQSSNSSPLRRSSRLRDHSKDQSLERLPRCKVEASEVVASQSSSASMMSSTNESSFTDSDYSPYKKKKRTTRNHSSRKTGLANLY
ncbi:serine-rich adhesin for platelets [Amia ocellicauda]|uniref:serine-rich adhesin for platelets n=1 Tax=Amia ocellicauda TaxID=2972642 RepID=UPI003463E5A6